MKKLTLLGLGVVGGGVARACAEPGAPWAIDYALVRDAGRQRGLPLAAEQITTDRGVALAGDGPVIEVMGVVQPATDLMAAVLKRGRPVATANKEALALHGPRLFALAREHGVGLGIEACVGGGGADHRRAAATGREPAPDRGGRRRQRHDQCDPLRDRGGPELRRGARRRRRPPDSPSPTRPPTWTGTIPPPSWRS